ncbi:unnamed protein product [Debaryomyces fabryi]|nr:unnamed protein product [Debaryomyces fabryi]
MWPFLDRIMYDHSTEEEYNKKMQQKSSSSSAITVGLVAAVGGFLYGYDTGLINDIMEMTYVKENFPANGHNFNVHERALITAILSLGTFFGALVAPLISDTWGRKFSIIVSSAIIFNVGNILQVSSTEVVLLCIGRAVSGLSVGILSAIVPLYQAEASPKWVRGSVVYTYQWAITWGLLIASAICQGAKNMLNSGSYRIPVGIQFLWALILSIGMLFLPESPRFHVQKDNIQEALKCLARLRKVPTDDPELIEELVEIKANYDYELSFGKATYIDCFRSGGGRNKQLTRMFTGIGVQAFQQSSGINFIFYYGVNFFASSGVNNYYLMSFITYAVNTLFTIPGIILIEVIGRRKLLLFGGIGMAVSNFIIAIVGVSMSDEAISSLICVSFSCVFIAFFASSWGGAVWALTSDIYGIGIRQKAISLTAATNWLVNFTFAFITPYLIDTGKHTAALGNKIFFIWGGCNALGVVFVYFMVYETKGLKLEEIDFMYKNCVNARASTKFKSQKIVYANQIATPISELLNTNTSHIAIEKSSGSNNHDDDDDDENSEINNNNFGLETGNILHNNLDNRNITIIPYKNIISPLRSFSSDSSSDSDSSSPLNDYEKYLHSLQKESSHHADTSQTSTSLLTDNKFSHLNSMNNVHSRGNFTEEDLKYLNDEYNLTISLKYPGASTGPLGVQPSTNMTVIAAPFFNAPPSDSDTDDGDEDDSETEPDTANGSPDDTKDSSS